METHKGEVVPITWVCHGIDCRYPHYHWRGTCTNCKLARQPGQEPRTFDRSKVKPRLALDPAAQAGKKHWVPPKPGAAPVAKVKPASSASAAGDVEMEEEETTAEVPLLVPAALDHRAVKLLIGQGMDVANQYRSHFKVAVVAHNEMQVELDLALNKLSDLIDHDSTKFAKEIADLQAEFDCLQSKVDALDGTASVDTAPGAINDLAGKLNLLLSKHLANMAKEDATFATAQDEVDAKIEALKVQNALAQSNKLRMDKANEELKEALEAKVAGLASGEDANFGHVEDAKAKQEVERAISDAIIPRWKEQNGLSAVPMEGVQAIILLTLKLAGTSHAAFSRVAPASMGSLKKKQKFGEFPPSWDADEEM